LTFGRARAHLDRLFERVRDAEVTYAEVGQTRQQALPERYRHQRLAADVGSGATAWAKAKEALATWQAQRHLGLGIYPPDAPVVAGTVVLATADIGPARIVLPCRVVYCTDEAMSFGFAYGTLPGHPERGEESFHVRLDDQGVVSFHVVAFSRPGDLATKLAGPIATSVQSMATRRYIEGIKRYVGSAVNTR
jgi:uncharacterized protein (UPF0548 family)